MTVQHEKSRQIHLGEVTREDLAAAYTRIIMEAPVGVVFVLTQNNGTDAAALRASVPYASPAARTWAGETLDRGRESVTSGAAQTQAGEATPIDELLFNVGALCERQRRAIDAALRAIPDGLVPREETTLGDPIFALAGRIEKLVALLQSAPISPDGEPR